MGIGAHFEVEHWVQQLSYPVLFKDALEGALTHQSPPLQDAPVSHLLEIGPSPVLTSLSRSWVSTLLDRDLTWMESIDPRSRALACEHIDAIDSILRLEKPIVSPQGAVFPNRIAFPWKRLKSSEEVEPSSITAISPESQAHSDINIYHMNWDEAPLHEANPPSGSLRGVLIELPSCTIPVSIKQMVAFTCTTLDNMIEASNVAEISTQSIYMLPLAISCPDSTSNATVVTTEVLRVLQALGKRDNPPTVVIVSYGCDGPLIGDKGNLGAETSLPIGAGVRGLVRTARIEMPRARLMCIDTDAIGRAAELATQVWREVTAGDGNLEVAYRNGIRWVPKLVLKTPDERTNAAHGGVGGSKALQGNAFELGTAVITGGLGGLGLVTAEVLVESGVRCVVLVSRSGRVKHSGQGLEERLQSLQASTGAKVVIEQCDMGVEDEVAAMLARVRSSHGPLRMVVHAAGVLSDALLGKQDAESMRSVFAPKADGAWYLHKHTQGDDLAAFVMYSSLSALIGNPGQVEGEKG